MKCGACGFNKPISSWRSVSLVSLTPNTKSKVKPDYYLQKKTSQYAQLYACPRCKTVRVKLPGDNS